MHKRDSVEYNKQKLINDKICNIFFSKPTDRTFEINVTGSGDPFASIIYREMLTELNGKDFPNLKVNLNTNGVMFTHQRLGIIYIKYIIIFIIVE